MQMNQPIIDSDFYFRLFGPLACMEPENVKLPFIWYSSNFACNIKACLIYGS